MINILKIILLLVCNPNHSGVCEGPQVDIPVEIIPQESIETRGKDIIL